MNDKPIQGSGPWYAVLTCTDNNVAFSTPAEMLDRYGPETEIEISIRRGAALPDLGSGDLWRVYGPGPSEDVALIIERDLIDDDGELTTVEQKLAQAHIWAAGLNRAEANAGDWNRGTELAATLHDLADRIAAFDGKLPGFVYLSFSFPGSFARLLPDAVAAVDQFAAAVLDASATPKKTASAWYHEAEKRVGVMRVQVECSTPAPVEEDPAILRDRIAELELRLAQERGEA